MVPCDLCGLCGYTGAVNDALALDASHHVASDSLEQAGTLALIGVAGALQFSIAVAQILLLTENGYTLVTP